MKNVTLRQSLLNFPLKISMLLPWAVQGVTILKNKYALIRAISLTGPRHITHTPRHITHKAKFTRHITHKTAPYHSHFFGACENRQPLALNASETFSQGCENSRSNIFTKKKEKKCARTRTRARISDASPPYDPPLGCKEVRFAHDEQSASPSAPLVAPAGHGVNGREAAAFRLQKASSAQLQCRQNSISYEISKERTAVRARHATCPASKHLLRVLTSSASLLKSWGIDS